MSSAGTSSPPIPHRTLARKHLHARTPARFQRSPGHASPSRTKCAVEGKRSVTWPKRWRFVSHPLPPVLACLPSCVQRWVQPIRRAANSHPQSVDSQSLCVDKPAPLGASCEHAKKGKENTSPASASKEVCHSAVSSTASDPTHLVTQDLKTPNPVRLRAQVRLRGSTPSPFELPPHTATGTATVVHSISFQPQFGDASTIVEEEGPGLVSAEVKSIFGGIQ